MRIQSEGERTATEIPESHGEELGTLTEQRAAELAQANEALEAEIADRRRLEAALRASMERFRIIAEHAYDGINICELLTVPEPDGNAVVKRRLIYCNQPFAEMSGHTREELMAADDLNALVVSRVPGETLEANERRLEQGLPYRGVSSWKRPDGRENYYDWVAVPVTFRGKRCLLGIDRDITERKKVADELQRAKDDLEARVQERAAELIQASEALRASEARYRRLFETAKDGILILDAETGKVLDVNPYLTTLLGYALDELVGKKLWEAGPFNDIEVCKIAVRKLQTQDCVRYEDLPLQARDGRLIAVEFVCSVYLVDHRKVIQCNIRDISERKRTEDTLRGAEEQVRQAQKMEAIGQLAGGVANEFNTMLSVINGRAELILERLAPDDPLRDPLELILNTGNRLAKMTGQILAFSRRQVLRSSITDLNEIVSNVNKMVGTMLPESVKLTTMLDPALRLTRADPVQFGQVLVNLVINARDAMPKGGSLTIETANVALDERYCLGHPGVKPGTYAMLSVKDTGCGMDDNVKAHLFEPFFTTKEKGKSAGLGLATVFGIVKQSGGEVEVHSQLGQGTTVRIYLPQAAGEFRVPARAPRHRLPRGTETVLVVEDEEEVRTLSREVLEAVGYTVIEASNGAQALAAFERQSDAVQLVITDVTMPGMGGMELVGHLRRLRPRIKVLLVSGFPGPSLSDQGRMSTGVHFLQKPVSLGVLARKVREMLDGSF